MSTRLRKFLGMAIVAFSLFAVHAAHAQNAIDSFNVSQQGGQIVARVGFKEALAGAPGSFTVANPARIAFDFPNTANALGRSGQEIGESDLRSMSVVQVGDRTRLVFNLRNMMRYETKVEGRTLLVTMTPSASSAAASRFAEGRPDVGHALTDVSFRRGRTGEGRILIDLSDASTGIDIRRQGQQIIIDFQKTSVPENLRKRLDVVDFGTPVQTVSTFPQGDNARIVIEPKGLWEHNAYQTDTQFVLEVKAVAYDPNKLVQGTRTGYQGEKLSLNFQNIEVRSVLNVIADFTDLNIITSDSVQGNLTLRLKDVPWDQALDIILQTRGLDMRKNGNVVWIAPRDELATKEKLTLESQQQITELEPVRTETFQLNYAKAIDVVRLLSDSKQSILSKRGSAVVDARTNQMFVQDVPSRLDDVRRLLAKLDIPVRQVLIEARVLDASESFAKTLGMRLGFSDSAIHRIGGPNGPFNTRFATGPTIESLPAGQGASTTGGPLNVNLPAQGVTGNNATFAISLFNGAQTRFINLEIQALESDGKIKLLSNPRVLTTNNIEALIEQGVEIPYQTTSLAGTSTQFRKASLALKVKPQITPDGNVIMTLDVNKDEPGETGPGGIAISTKHVKTEVLVENGGTVVIGGIYTQNVRSSVTKVPLFGDLPVIGNLFRSNFRSDQRTELLVFITPRIVQEQVGLR